MIKLIRSNQKYFLAGLMILSMLGFVVNRGNGDRGRGDDRKYATLAGKDLYLSELTQSRAEIDALRNYLHLPKPGTLDAYIDQEITSKLLGEKTELFMLLRHEASALGMHASEDEIQRYLANYTSKGVDPEGDAYAALHAAIGDLITIMSRYHMLRDAQKVSRPRLDQELAQSAEKLQLKLVQLRAEDFLDKVTPPTTQQVQGQFNEFASSLPNHPTPTTNPLGFGYKQPERVSFQYLRLTDDAITAAVIASKKDSYEWDVLARKYYHANIDKFAEDLSDQSATKPASPKSFEAVRDEILTQLRQEPTSTLRDQVDSFISSTMNNDWLAYSKFVVSNPAGVEPDSSLGVPYTSFTYLLKIYDAVHAKFNVNLTADKSPENLSEDQFKNLPDGGSSAIAQFISKQLSDVLESRNNNDKNAAAVLVQPSSMLQGQASGSKYFVRLATANAAQVLSDYSTSRIQVESDLRKTAAYKIAQQQADALLIAAKSNTLEAAALAIGHPVIPPDPASALSLNSTDVKGVFPPLGASATAFTQQAFKLLASYEPAQNPHPAATVALPEQARVFVAQLASVDANWNTRSFSQYANQAMYGPAGPIEQQLATEWFDLKKVQLRMGFKPVKGD